jgi:hypothetical protein
VVLDIATLDYWCDCDHVIHFQICCDCHRIVNDGNDDFDIKREIANLFIRTNILRRRFFNYSPAM